MKNCRRMSTTFSLVLAAIFWVAPAIADSELDKEIKELRSRLSQLEEQQIELKKEATEAAAALPTFTYRPRGGLTIEAADKSWSMRTEMEAHMRWLFMHGRDEVGRTQGEVMGRRFRPGWWFCVNNCLWEIETQLDLDGFGTQTDLQRGVVHFNADNISPWLPRFTFGMDISTAPAATITRQGSSATGAQREYDMLSREVGANTGRSGNGFTFTWDNRSLKSIGIPGRITRYQIGVANVSEGDNGASSFTDRKDFTTYIGIQPFADTKNKWLRGLFWEFGAWFCNRDGKVRNESGTRAETVGSAIVTGTRLRGGEADDACDRVRLRDHGDGGKQTLFDTGGGSIGDGLATYVSPGFGWTIGPYRLRVMGGFFQAEDRGFTSPVDGTGTSPGKKRGHNFLIGHDLWIWSPKGFLTGNANTPGAILLGTHFERNDVFCENALRCNGINGGQFHRNTVLLREWDIWYVIMPGMHVGVNWLWYDAKNIQVGTNSPCFNLGLCKHADSGRDGRGGDWVDWSITWRYSF